MDGAHRGLYVLVYEAVAVAPVARLFGEAVAPRPGCKETEPVAFVAAVSVAVAVQIVDVPTVTEEGAQPTEVVVGSTFCVMFAP